MGEGKGQRKRLTLHGIAPLLKKHGFDVNKYASCGKFGFKEWADALAARWRLQQPRQEHDDVADALLSNVIKEPTGLHFQFVARARFQRDARPLRWVTDGATVREATAYEAWCLRDEMCAINPQAAKECEAVEQALIQPSRPRPAKMLKERVLESGLTRLIYAEGSSNEFVLEHLLWVDMLATEEQICSDFRNWVRGTRKRILERTPGPPKRFTVSHLKRWTQMRLLAYMDLMLLLHHLDVELSQATIGEILFRGASGGGDTTERVRKVVMPEASWIMSNVVFDAFQSFAAHVARNRNKNGGQNGPE